MVASGRSLISFATVWRAKEIALLVGRIKRGNLAREKERKLVGGILKKFEQFISFVKGNVDIYHKQVLFFELFINW